MITEADNSSCKHKANRGTKVEYPLNLLQAIAKLYNEEWNYTIPEDIIGTIEYVFHTYLSTREADILRSRYIAENTLQFIADSIHVTQERVRQLIVKALSKLYNTEAKELLINGVQGYIQVRENNIIQNTKKLVYSNLVGISTQAKNIYQRVCEYSENFAPHLSEDIESLKLSERNFRALKRTGINTIGDLIALTPEQLASVKYMGIRSYNEIVSALKDRGLTLSKVKNED